MDKMETTHEALSSVLEAVTQRRDPQELIGVVLEHCCRLANAAHGSFILIDHVRSKLKITSTFGHDWAEEKREFSLSLGQGITGTVAQTGQPYICNDAARDPVYVGLFDYVKSELAVPVKVRGKVWGIINLDGLIVNAFNEKTIETVILFAEVVAFAFTLQEEFREQERMQEQLLQSQKLASLGKVIAGIAHEINNPLTTILGHATMLNLNPQEPPEPSAVHAIISESQRAAEIVRALLEFARKEIGTKKVVNVSDLIRQVCDIKKYQLRVNNIVIHFEQSAELLPVEVNSQQIRQVLLNLVTNAEQAIPEGASGVIKIWAKKVDQVVRVFVQDNGAGIPEAIRAHIFDPFFSTKKVGEGTGLGLSMALTIIESHNGRLFLEKTSSVGTTFVLEFPLASGPVMSSDTKLVPTLPTAVLDNKKGKSLGRILVVDDEQGILQFVSRFLTAQNIQVSTAVDGLDGLEKLKEQKFDAVISDIKMPGLGGLEFYDKAKRIYPEYTGGFLFISGDLMKESTRDFVSKTGCRFLQKPFTGQALRDGVLDLLRERQAAKI